MSLWPSMTRTERPSRARVIAAARPFGPEPMMTASYCAREGDSVGSAEMIARIPNARGGVLEFRPPKFQKVQRRAREKRRLGGGNRFRRRFESGLTRVQEPVVDDHATRKPRSCEKEPAQRTHKARRKVGADPRRPILLIAEALG